MTDRAVQPEAPTTEAGRRFVHYADNVQRAIHPLPRQPTVPHTCKEPEACDLILEAKQHVLAIEAEARAASQERPPIDVVRLAKAMALVYVTGHPIHEAVEHWESYRTDATELIAAYGAAEELDD
jgi:hypothetical protein